MSIPVSTIEEWLKLAQQKCAAAFHLLQSRMTAEAFEAAGFAVEFTLKAAVMRHERLNRWPPASSRPELHTHNLVALLSFAGVRRDTLLRETVAPKLQTVLLWKRSDTYMIKATPVAVARDMVKAACGGDGVNVWLRSRFQLDT